MTTPALTLRNLTAPFAKAAAARGVPMPSPLTLKALWPLLDALGAPDYVSPLSVSPHLIADDTLVAPGARQAQVRVRLSEAARRPLVWRYLTSNRTAYEGGFYARTSGTVLFLPGEVEKLVTVPVLRDLGEKTFAVDFAWGDNYPAVGSGVSAIVRQGQAVPVVVTPPVSYPAALLKTGRALAFSSTFQEPVVPGVVPGTWRSRFDWGRVQTANREIAPYTDATTDEGVTPHPIVDGKRVLCADYVPTTDNGTAYAFSASLIDSANLFSFQYGYVELRVKFARVQGSATAFWLLPASGKWPPEIDIFETGLGDRPNPQSSVHFRDDGFGTSEGVMLPQVVEDGEWHVIGFDWTRDWQVTFIDGVEVVRRPNLFNEPMKIVLDVSVGGLGPDPINPKPGWRSEMALDYLKVWR